MYPKVGTVFEYEDTDHEDWCSTSGTYKVTSVSDPNRFGQRVVAVEAVDAANPTSGILNWEDQVKDGTIHGVRVEHEADCADHCPKCGKGHDSYSDLEFGSECIYVRFWCPECKTEHVETYVYANTWYEDYGEMEG